MNAATATIPPNDTRDDDTAHVIEVLGEILVKARAATPKARRSGRRITSASSPRALDPSHIAAIAEAALTAACRL